MKNFLLFTVSNRRFACAFEDILRIEPAAGGGAAEITPVPGFPEENPIKVHPNIIYSTFCGSRMFLFSVSPLSRNL